MKVPDRPPEDWMQCLPITEGKIDGDKAFRERVIEYNRRYLAWDELKHRVRDPDRRRAMWGLMKFLRVLRHEQVPFEPLPLTYSQTSDIGSSLHAIDRYLSGTIHIHNKTIRFEQSYIINSLMEEAVASSILEGAATTRTIAKEMLRKGRKPRNRAERMVLNAYEAMRFISEHRKTPLTPSILLEIHRIVTNETIEDVHVGRFRESNDVVVADPSSGFVYHVPPDYTEIPSLIEAICDFANHKESEDETEEFIHPVIKGIALHFLIGYLHPFNDGNGRTARSVFYWYVLSRGYWLFEFMPISRVILRAKRKYGLAYLHTEYDDRDLTYFLKYNLSCITEALKDLMTYLEKKQTEQNATRAIIQTIPDLNQRQAEIVRRMMEHSDQYFTIREIMQLHGVVYETARSDLIRLNKLGYTTMEKRGREFVFIFNERSELWRSPSPQTAPKPTRENKQMGLDAF